MFRHAPLLLLTWLFSPALLAQNQQWKEVNLAITDGVIVPAYERFALATVPLTTDAAGFCAAVTQDNLAKLQQDFQQAMDGWQGVQHIQFGPITYFNWNYRLQFWPDDNNAGTRQMDTLLAAADPAVLAPAAFAQQSVGVQGFQALERLLFSNDSLAALQKTPFRCQLVQAIAHNLGDISTGLAKRWHDEFRTTVANADQRGGYFENSRDVTLDYLKAVVESVRRIQRQKLEAVLADSQAAAHERKAESWRSDRSVRNLRVNVAAFAALFSQSKPALSSVLPAADIPAITAAFDKVEKSLAAAPDSMTTALKSPQGYAALKQSRDDINALYEALEVAVKHTDLYLGFNSLDGD